MKLRPHHALCMQFFKGVGYSEDFSKHMTNVLTLDEDTQITVTDGFDSLCDHCPNHPDGECIFIEKVSKYDDNVMKICHFQVGEKISIKEFKGRAKELIIDKGLVSNVCSECEFLYICDKNDIKN